MREHVGDYDSEWAAMYTVAARLGMTATLRKWVRQAEVDAGEAAGVPSETARELRELRRKCRAGGDEILNARNEFLRAGVRPATPLICQFVDGHGPSVLSFRNAVVDRGDSDRRKLLLGARAVDE